MKWHAAAMHLSAKISPSDIFLCYIFKACFLVCHAQTLNTNTSPQQSLSHPFLLILLSTDTHLMNPMPVPPPLLCHHTTKVTAGPLMLFLLLSSSHSLSLSLSLSLSALASRRENPRRGQEILSYRQRHLQTVEPNCSLKHTGAAG